MTMSIDSTPNLVEVRAHRIEAACDIVELRHTHDVEAVGYATAQRVAHKGQHCKHSEGDDRIKFVIVAVAVGRRRGRHFTLDNRKVKKQLLVGALNRSGRPQAWK